MRVTLQMGEYAMVRLRDVYWVQDFISDVGGFFICIYGICVGIYALVKFRHDEN